MHSDVQAFAKEAKGLPEVTIVDYVIAYYCTSSGETYLLVVRNALCAPTMDINMIPTFVLREAGLILNDTRKIQCKDSSVEDHPLFYGKTGLRILFTLIGNFSMFETSSLTEDEIVNAENYSTIFLTPDSKRWDSYNESYKMDED